jgi:hypothetical protein
MLKYALYVRPYEKHLSNIVKLWTTIHFNLIYILSLNAKTLK